MANNPRPTTVQSGDSALLRLPSGDVKSVKVDRDSLVVAGRLGSIPANDLIGKTYGVTYELADKTLKSVPPPSIQEIEDTDATNELINDGEFVQPLTITEIQALKHSGVHASDIIKKQIEQHANYSLKTEYSKEKYKKRKEAKYSKTFTIIEPTLFNVVEYWFAKDQSRIRDLRCDSLSQMLNLASVRPGGRYLAVDDASGILVAAILERLGGEGRLLTICATDSPPSYPALVNMNYPKDITSVLGSLNWSTAEEDYTPIGPPSEVPSDQVRTERHRSRLNKRKANMDNLMNIREELLAGEFEGLLVASEFDLYSVVEKLEPYLNGSASIVLHSPHSQLLVDVQQKMRSLPRYLSPSITESWLRRYQVLPGRTHPTMNTSGTGGFLLQTTKVYDDPSASSVLSHRRPKKRKATVDSNENSREGDAGQG